MPDPSALVRQAELRAASAHIPHPRPAPRVAPAPMRIHTPVRHPGSAFAELMRRHDRLSPRHL